MVEDFNRAVLDTRDPLFPPEDGIAQLRVIDAIFQAAREGRQVRITVHPTLRDDDGVVGIGGGAVLTEPHLSKWYPEKLLRFDQNVATKGIDPVDANAVGGIRLAKMRINKSQS